jgi:chromatin segregation and condensation protein Rec8/ScpA/Scc1 (kleisin family)
MNKSKALIKIDPNEEESEDSLKETLLKYQAIKAKAALLAELSRKPFLSKRNYARSFNWPTAISSYELNETYNTIANNIKNKKSTRQIKTPKHRLDRAKAEFISHISKLKSFSVNEVLNNSRSKSEAVVYFVTILDLLKKGNLIINEDYIKVGAIA